MKRVKLSRGQLVVTAAPTHSLTSDLSLFLKEPYSPASPLQPDDCKRRASEVTSIRLSKPKPRNAPDDKVGRNGYHTLEAVVDNSEVFQIAPGSDQASAIAVS